MSSAPRRRARAVPDPATVASARACARLGLAPGGGAPVVAAGQDADRVPVDGDIARLASGRRPRPLHPCLAAAAPDTACAASSPGHGRSEHARSRPSRPGTGDG